MGDAVGHNDDINLEEFNIDSEESDAEEIPLTAAQVISLIEEAWLNEKFAPEILPHKSEVVDCLLGQINYMDENLRSLETTDLQKNIHQLEVDRLRFLLTSYLRTRLEKIETFAFNVLDEELKRRDKSEDLYLTEGEFTLAKEFKEAMVEQFESALRFMPGLPPDDWKSQPVVPNLNSYVFLKSKTAVEGIVIGEDHKSIDVDTKIGSQYIMPYSSVRNLVINGDINFI